MKKSNLFDRNSTHYEWFRKSSWEIGFCALIGTLMANILCLPLWTDCDVMGFLCTPLNKKAHMEIVYTGTLTGSEPFAITSSESSLNTSTNFSYGEGTQLYRVDLPIEEEWKSYSFTLKVRKKGSIRISLKGPLKCNDYGEKYSIFVDYRNLKISDKQYFPDRRKVTHAKCFAHHVPVNENDTVKISFDARRHHFDADDFNLSKTKNFWYIITLSIFAFAFFYILLQRIFALWKMGKTEDCCFLFTFFSLLAVPLCSISDAQYGSREGRALTPRPNVSLVLKEGSNYGKRYDNWLSDHLGGRQWLIKIHDVIQRETHQILRGRIAWYMQDSGWLFQIPDEPRPRSKDLRLIVKALGELKKFCEMNRIKLYVFVVPRKQTIYPEKLYFRYEHHRKEIAAENAIHEAIKQLAAKQHITYIYPWKELRDACKQDYTYFKRTHHWTDWGAFVGYRTLMQAIRKDFPDIPLVSLADYKLTQSCLIRDDWMRNFWSGGFELHFNFGIDRRCPAVTYNYYDNINSDKLVLNVGDFTKDFRYRGGVYKIMLFGTSQNENLLGYLPYSASTTRYIRTNRNFKIRNGDNPYNIIRHYKNDILSYKPDILIFSLFAPNVVSLTKPQ